MKLITHAVLASAIILGASAQSSADPLSFTNPYTANGSGSSVGSNPLYFGGSLGLSSADDFCSGVSNCEDSDMGWKLFAGYDLSERLAVEGGYASLGKYSGTGATSEVSGFELSAVGKMPLNDQIGLFGKAGLFKWTADNHDGERSATDVLFGAGVDYKYNTNTSLRGEWQRFNDIETQSTSTSDVDMYSVGFTYRTY